MQASAWLTFSDEQQLVRSNKIDSNERAAMIVQPRNGGRPSPLRFAGAGIELAGAVLVSAGLGFAADTFFAWEGNLGFLIGSLLGFAMGLANLLRLAAAYNRD